MYKTPEERKDEIKKYVIDHENCSKEEVIRFLTEKRIGSKVPLSRDLKELIDDGILDAGKEYENSKSYKLTVIANNPLLLLPREYETLYLKFNDFVKVIKQLLQETDGGRIRPIQTVFPIRAEVNMAYDHIPILPYSLIDIIDDFYNFYFTFQLPIENKNNDILIRLYSLYQKMILKMRSLVTTEINYVDNVKDLSDISETPMYKSYVDSIGLPILEKLGYITNQCVVLGVDKRFFEVLHFLWNTNKKILPLVYDLPNLMDDVYIDMCLKNSEKSLPDYYEYDDKSIRNIHIYLDSNGSWLLKSIGYLIKDRN